MVLYKCSSCLKEFNKKSNYKAHLNRKFPCKLDKSLQDNNKLSVPKMENINNLYICNYCNRSYSRKPNLNKHLKSCKVKIEKELHKNTYEILLNKINNLSIIIENQNKIIEDLQEITKGNIRI